MTLSYSSSTSDSQSENVSAILTRVTMKTLEDLLTEVLDWATGDIDNPKKRIWPIKASLYKEIANKIGCQYDSKRVMGLCPLKTSAL